MCAARIQLLNQELCLGNEHQVTPIIIKNLAQRPHNLPLVHLLDCSAVRYGLFFGFFTFLYKLSLSLFRYAREKHSGINSVISGIVATCAVLLAKSEDRIALILFLLTIAARTILLMFFTPNRMPHAPPTISTIYNQKSKHK